MMKKIALLLAVAVSMMLLSCGSPKIVAVPSAPIHAESSNGEYIELPAAEYDTDDSFGATGTAYGPKKRMDVLQLQSLTHAQEQIRQKIQHVYKGAIETYARHLGNNDTTILKTEMRQVGKHAMNMMVNDTKTTKVLISPVDEKGNVTCYTGIRVDKQKTVNRILTDLLNDQELKLPFEDMLRKFMEESFKKYKDDKKQ